MRHAPEFRQTEPAVHELQCPPCSGECRQGRDCPASAEVQAWDAHLPLLAVVAAVVVVGVLAGVI